MLVVRTTPELVHCLSVSEGEQDTGLCYLRDGARMGAPPIEPTQERYRSCGLPGTERKCGISFARAPPGTWKPPHGWWPAIRRSCWAHYEYPHAVIFAVRENQMAVAGFLLDRGANPFYNGEDLIEMARIRRLPDMEALIDSRRARASHRSAGRAKNALADGARRRGRPRATGHRASAPGARRRPECSGGRQRAARPRALCRGLQQTRSTSPGFSSNTGRIRIRKLRALSTLRASRS